MIMRAALVILLAASIQPGLSAQPKLSKEETYKVYSNFVGGKWETKGKWKGGAEFHQEIIVEPELTANIFTVKTHDYIDSKQFDHARRNYGIRAWDKTEQKMKFWEFDVFGGIIIGEVIIEGKDIYHVYEYPDKDGKLRRLADAWIYVDKDTYTYKICDYQDGKPGKEYLSSTYHRK